MKVFLLPTPLPAASIRPWPGATFDSVATCLVSPTPPDLALASSFPEKNPPRSVKTLERRVRRCVGIARQLLAAHLKQCASQSAHTHAHTHKRPLCNGCFPVACLSEFMTSESGLVVETLHWRPSARGAEPDVRGRRRTTRSRLRWCKVFDI